MRQREWRSKGILSVMPFVTGMIKKSRKIKMENVIKVTMMGNASYDLGTKYDTNSEMNRI